MKNIFITIVILFTVFWLPEDSGSQTLYPITGLQLGFIEDAVYGTWNKPMNPMGQTPPGLTGYKVYRNGSLFCNINDPDTLIFYDITLDSTGMYTYGITAYYDMTPYGNPGIFQESSVTEDSIMYSVHYCVIPFIEPWDEGNFSFNDWNLVPDMCNWVISVYSGNPAPTAAFYGNPSLTAYNHSIISHGLHKASAGCMHYFFEFDYKLDDINADSSEILTAGIYDINSIWIPVASFKNKGSTNWNHVSLDLTNILYSDFKIGLSASGVNSSHISSWMVDNIHVFGTCDDPQNLSAVLSGNVVQLSWDEVSCSSSSGLAGYDIFRTNPSGNRIKVNPVPVTSNYFSDTLPLLTNAQYLYNVCALYIDTISLMFFCSSPGADTVTVNYMVGLEDSPANPVSLSPNPASTFVTVTSDQTIENISIFDPTGNMIRNWSGKKRSEFTFQVSELRNGIYFLQIRNSAGKPSVHKLIINH